jgi:probable F420-dependent oxidoreductase
MASDDELAALRDRLGPAGIWMPSPARINISVADAAAAIEAAGFTSAWVGGGSVEPDAFERLGNLLTASERLVVAPGIANIWARPPARMRDAACDLEQRFPGRFVLGLGVSHAPLVADLGRAYDRPVEAMERYLDELDHPASHHSRELPPIVLAALGPRMLRLSRDHADGAHPYFTPPEHTSHAREVLGSRPLLIPEQAVVISGGREDARAYISRYLAMPNYVASLHRLGFGDDELAGGGSDRLVDAIVPRGAAVAAARVREHLAAGADHVVIQPLGAGGQFEHGDLPALAEALGGLMAAS